ncbi:hypothetical protein AAHC03_013139 [Spirometra sp. Aus1]|nr:unnamed protein product [Spirometra erinaceieuropaei]
MDRSRLYKNKSKDNEELRRRRIDQSVELRKAKKDEQLQKRRNVLEGVDETSPLKEKQMGSRNQEVQLQAIQTCRKTLSRAKNPPIDEFFGRGVVSLLTAALDAKSDSIVFEAAWALTNIASGESHHTQGVVDSGASPKLINLLSHKDIRIAEQCIWALGNIAGDGTSQRDMLIRMGVVEPTLRLLDRAWGSPGVVANIAWMLSNLCRNKNPHPPRETIQRLLPVLNKLLGYSQSVDVVIDAAWALSYASDSANDFINDILASNCVPPLIKLLGSGTPGLISPALRAIGNLVLGDDDQTQAIVDAGVLAYMPNLLNSDRSSIIKESCWMLSNITAGNIPQIQSVIDAKIVPRVLELMLKEEFKIQKEACWVISNMINGGSPEQRAYLLNQNVLAALSKLLTVADVRVLVLVLEAVRRLFETANEFGQLEQCCLSLEACGGLDSLEQLQDHSNEQVYQAAYDMIVTFFNDAGNSTTEAPEGEEPNAPNDSQEFHFVPQPTQTGSTDFEF